jgi:hypothetical protein
MQLADDDEEDDNQEDEVSIQPVKTASTSSTPAPSPLSPTFDPSITQKVSTKVYPQTDLHGLALRYTPDDLIDLSSYTSGVITVRIHEVKLNMMAEAYCQILVDSLQSQYKTETIKGRTLAYNEISDAFIKDVGFSRVAIVLKPAAKSEKEDDTLGYWYDSSDHIINAIQQRQRAALINGTTVPDITKGDGEWYALINPVGGGTAKIRLSFDYVPLLNYTVDPNESLESKI